jgi:ATP-dependent helicase/nuclease subunit A
MSAHAQHDVFRPAYSVDGRPLSRERFYAAACDPQRSVVVEACAGAGKTWMLVSRMLRALLDGAQPHEILAITFTRKAAGEMRSRLEEWLCEFASPSCGDDKRAQALRERGLDEAQARELAPSLASLHERVLRACRPIEIRTFHAWFSQLLRGAPLEVLAELGLHAQMELIEDITELASDVYRRFHAVVLADPVLRDDYTTLVRQRGRAQLRKWLDSALDKRIEIEFADAAGTLEASVPPAHLHWQAYAGWAHPMMRLRSAAAQSLLDGVIDALTTHRSAVCRTQGALLAQAARLENDAQRYDAARAALYTQKGQPRKQLEAAGLADLISLLDDIERACAQQAAHEEHLRMVRLARALLVEFAAYKRARGLADMEDLERCALALLRDATLSGWVQERLDTRFRHVLIDEFQDTSPLQWHALHAWLSAYAGAGGGASGQRPPGVFIVGDPKQSIYRFRRAEPRVFDAARDFVRDALGGSVLECDHTRRNAPAVLSVVNRVFDEARQAGEFAGFRPHTTEVGAEPLAGVYALPCALRPDKAAETRPLDAWRDSLTTPRLEADEVLRQQEARQVALAVQELASRHRVPLGDIHVLCRKHVSLRLASDALAALHIPCVAAEEYVLLDAAEARDLVALLDALVSPSHRLSLAHALRSPVFGASDDDLIALAQASAAHGDWWRALSDVEAPSPTLRRARDLLMRWQMAAQDLPPHDLLDLIVAEGEVRERFAAAVPPERRIAALGAIDALLGQALMLDGARYATPYNFVRALRRRAVKVPAAMQADAVQLLTIHGAKGLEARIVFVLDSDPEPKGGETATLLVDWPVESIHPLRCAFVYSESQCPPSLQALLAGEQAARRREEYNGLYVAMTRAKQRLVFSATEPSRRDEGPSWWQRVEAYAQAWAPLPDAAPHAASTARTVAMQRLPVWEEAAAIEGQAGRMARTLPLDDEASRLGQAVHRVLEWAAVPGRGDVPKFESLAISAARDFMVGGARVAQIAEHIWRSPGCAPFFAGDALRWAGNEVAIAHAGDVVRIDRLVAMEDAGRRTWWVLDYKLRHAPQELAEYREQMLRYRAAVSAVQPGDAVRAAFITGAGELIEIE